MSLFLDINNFLTFFISKI